MAFSGKCGGCFLEENVDGSVAGSPGPDAFGIAHIGPPCGLMVERG